MSSLITTSTLFDTLQLAMIQKVVKLCVQLVYVYELGIYKSFLSNKASKCDLLCLLSVFTVFRMVIDYMYMQLMMSRLKWSVSKHKTSRQTFRLQKQLKFNTIVTCTTHMQYLAPGKQSTLLCCSVVTCRIIKANLLNDPMSRVVCRSDCSYIVNYLQQNNEIGKNNIIIIKPAVECTLQ